LGILPFDDLMDHLNKLLSGFYGARRFFSRARLRWIPYKSFSLPINIILGLFRSSRIKPRFSFFFARYSPRE